MTAARHIKFLASVRDEDEAQLAAAHGADIVDCKEPLNGALGALPVERVAAIRAALPARIPVSATVGDLPCRPGPLVEAVRRMSSTGVDIVKIGIFPNGDACAAVAALGELDVAGCGLVAVLFADLGVDRDLIAAIGAAGFAGVMLDTARKDGGRLTAHMSAQELHEFMSHARRAKLFAGLAGSLREEDIAGLRALGPDVLGFRGALCDRHVRSGGLNAGAIRRIGNKVRGEAESEGERAALARAAVS